MAAASPSSLLSQRRPSTRRMRKALLPALLAPLVLAGPINPAAAALIRYSFDGDYSKTSKDGFDWLRGAKLQGSMTWDTKEKTWKSWKVQSLKSPWQAEKEETGELGMGLDGKGRPDPLFTFTEENSSCFASPLGSGAALKGGTYHEGLWGSSICDGSNQGMRDNTFTREQLKDRQPLFFSVMQYIDSKESGFKATVGFRLAFLPGAGDEAPTLLGLKDQADKENAGGIESQDWYGSTFRFGWNDFSKDKKNTETLRSALCGGYASNPASLGEKGWITDACPFAPEETKTANFSLKAGAIGTPVLDENGNEVTDNDGKTVVTYSRDDYEEGSFGPGEVTGQTFLASLRLSSEVIEADSNSNNEEPKNPSKEPEDNDPGHSNHCNEHDDDHENDDDDHSGNCKAQTPAPLPIAGAGAAFAWSRRVRRRYTLVPAKAQIVA